MKTVAATLGVARSNVIERKDGARPKRGPQTRAGDVELAADIRRLVDARPNGRVRKLHAKLLHVALSQTAGTGALGIAGEQDARA